MVCSIRLLGALYGYGLRCYVVLKGIAFVINLFIRDFMQHLEEAKALVRNA